MELELNAFVSRCFCNSLPVICLCQLDFLRTLSIELPIQTLQLFRKHCLQFQLVHYYFLNQVGTWTGWGLCDSKCSVGTKTRSRSVSVTKRCNGAACPALRVICFAFSLSLLNLFLTVTTIFV